MNVIEGFVVTSARAGEEVIITICGELDFATCPALVEAVDATVSEVASVCVLDFERVTFIDSEALKALLRAHREMVDAGRKFEVRGCSRQVMKVVDMLGVRDQIGWSGS